MGRAATLPRSRTFPETGIVTALRDAKIMTVMKTIVPDASLVAACGLYCGACRKYLTEKCPGCGANEEASWCRIRTCVKDRSYRTCAECATPVTECKTCNTFISKVFAVIFRSDRPACVQFIKENGEQMFAEEMSRRKCQTIKRK